MWGRVMGSTPDGWCCLLFFGSCIAWDGGVAFAFVLYIAFGKGVGIRSWVEVRILV